jgi:hypothetical protein
MKKHPQFFISKSPRRSRWVGITIGIDLGGMGSSYCTSTKTAKWSTADVFAQMLLG